MAQIAQLTPAQALVPEILRYAMVADEGTNSDVLEVYYNKASVLYHRLLTDDSRTVFAALCDAEKIDLRAVRAATNLDVRPFFVALHLLRAIEFVDAKWTPTAKGHRILNPDYKMPESPQRQLGPVYDDDEWLILRILAYAYRQRRRVQQNNVSSMASDFFGEHIPYTTVRRKLPRIIENDHASRQGRGRGSVYLITAAGLAAVDQFRPI